MRKFLFLIIIIAIILIGIFVYNNLSKQKPEENTMSIKSIKDKKIAMFIAFREFRDEEYFIPKNILESAGAQIITVSDSLGIAIGKLGGEVEVDLLISDLKIDDYDAILFIGGPGASKYIDNKSVHQIAKEAVEKNKILGAICVAPAILARAGVLKGKKATVWSSAMDKSAVKILKESGADYQDEPLVIDPVRGRSSRLKWDDRTSPACSGGSASNGVDGKIITASGPLFAEDFAKAIISAL